MCKKLLYRETDYIFNHPHIVIVYFFHQLIMTFTSCIAAMGKVVRTQFIYRQNIFTYFTRAKFVVNVCGSYVLIFRHLTLNMWIQFIHKWKHFVQQVSSVHICTQFCILNPFNVRENNLIEVTDNFSCRETWRFFDVISVFSYWNQFNTHNVLKLFL
jgi:hypothetical protein